MEYRRFLAVMLVLGILGVEPAGAVEIGSLNQFNSPDTLNSCAIAQNMVKKSAVVNQDHNKCLNKLEMHSSTGINETILNQTGNKTVINETDFNQTIGNENETVLNNSIDENKTVFNETGNGTFENETNVNGTALNNTTYANETSLNQTDNATQDSPAKTHTLNTIENVGYALAAIAGCFAVGIAVAPEGITKTICVVGAVLCGVAAAACFVAHAIASWFDW
ncbi:MULTISPECIES: hypothetical protein [Methanobacterium]|uniref:Uncharacterized protein n=1 Tax=Methanobacterium bryantii TaxID=2161 RepID=A0A2A2H931_METBR|nr:MULTISPECIES: hypothetical protein [Methanobacterium]OEC85669.1 hypothetical protein A9507_12995 [Methanobacterium sp. A39]PAV05897.1 hypothetical protein ASJ80_13625 [Methanobacterium bryantii]